MCRAGLQARREALMKPTSAAGLLTVIVGLSTAPLAFGQTSATATPVTVGNAVTPPIVDAARRGDAAGVRALIAKKADVNAAAPDGSTALHWAAERDDLGVIEALLKAGARADAKTRHGVTPVSLSALNGSGGAIARLLAAGADPNSTMNGETALMTAARAGRVEALRALLAAGADVSTRVGSTGQTPLMWAASRNNAEAVRLLLEAGVELNARTARTAPTPRPNAAATAAQALVTNFEGGRSMFNSPPPTGFTAFLFGVRSGSIDAVKALLDAGANVNDTLSDGSSALVVAAANAHWELASLLLDRGADPNLAGAGWTALHQAVRIRRPNIGFGTPGPIPTGTVDSIDVIRKMIAKGANVNARMSRNGMKDGQRNRLNRLGATPFLLAAKNTDVEVMKLLVAAGADPKIPTADGTTPLMVAAGVAIWNPGEDGGSLPGQEGEVLEAVKMCVELGNDVNASNHLGETALHGAAFRGVNELVQYLAGQGARLDARDNRGWTALAIANGLTYTDFFKQQVHTAKLLRELMTARGLPTEGHAVDPKVCLDCLQTRADQQREVFERDRRMEAEWAARERSAQQP
jgi:ankyrin repeat protein